MKEESQAIAAIKDQRWVAAALAILVEQLLIEKPRPAQVEILALALKTTHLQGRLDQKQRHDDPTKGAV